MSSDLPNEFTQNEYFSIDEQLALEELERQVPFSRPTAFAGKLIVFEGADKLGKSTLVKLFSHALKTVTNVSSRVFTFPNKQDHMNLVKITRLPNATIQQKILSHALSHALTYPMILEHIAQQGVALCDRYWFSNLVYPTTLNNIPEELIWSVEYKLIQPPTPHLTVFFVDSNLYPKFSSERENIDELDNLKIQDRKRILLKYEELYHKFSSSSEQPLISQHAVVFPVCENEKLSASLVRLSYLVYNNLLSDKLNHQRDIMSQS